MRWFLFGALALTIVATTSVFNLGSREQLVPDDSCAQPPDRIVFFVIDTLRADVPGFAGGPATTPTLDRLATEGQAFDDAVAAYHATTMSMAALFTGRTPSLESGDRRKSVELNGRTWCGLFWLQPHANEARCIPAAIPTLAEVLASLGYETLGVVSNELLFAPFGLERGFDRWEEVGGRIIFTRPGIKEREAAHRSRAAAAVNARVMDVLRGRSSDRFFLYVHYMDVHDYALRSFDREKYVDAVTTVDSAIREVVEFLEREALSENALIVVTSDHGERFGEQHLLPGTASHAGNPSFEELLRVPLIVHPGCFAATEHPMRGQDTFRRITEIAGANLSMSPDLEDGELFVSEKEWQTYRNGRWKSFLPRSGDRLHLVDLETDPAERRDVAPAHPAIAQAHRMRIQTFTTQLATARASPTGLTPEDKRRLRALGYLDD